MLSLAHDTPQLAEAYERLSDSQLEAGKRLVERLGVKPGDRVLDVGCGTGRLARHTAAIAGNENVHGVDPLPDRVALAERHAPALSFSVGQAEDLRAFADSSFDVVCMSAVFHWVRDKPKALAEARRVLRPRGRLGLTTIPKELRLTSTIAQVCAPLLAGEPYASRIDTAALARTWLGSTTTEIIGGLVEAGFGLCELHVMRRTQVHASGSTVVDFLEASAFGNFLGMVPDDLRAAFRAELIARLEARRGPQGIALEDHGLVAVAERP